MPRRKAVTTPYIATLRARFYDYRRARFAGKDYLFEPRPQGDAVVFRDDHLESNLLIPPMVRDAERQLIVKRLPAAKRHDHFGSMQSSQALAQSVFGTIAVLDRLSLLTGVAAEGGQSAFGPDLNKAALELEKPIRTLGEQPRRSTSVDVWVNSRYHVAVECKLGETFFGRCSRPGLTQDDSSFATQYCDGTYSRQRERTSLCALTEIGVRYWDYMEPLFGWGSNTVHRPCPLNDTYQLVRNILASCVRDDGKLAIDSGHALIIYDRRNPAMAIGGDCDRQWKMISASLRFPHLLRRVSWQSLIAQWPRDEVLGWLKEELAVKYGLHANEASKASIGT